MRKTEIVTVSLSPEVLQAVDASKGAVKRSTYIEIVLRDALKLKERSG